MCIPVMYGVTLTPTYRDFTIPRPKRAIFNGMET